MDGGHSRSRAERTSRSCLGSASLAGRLTRAGAGAEGGGVVAGGPASEGGEDGGGRAKGRILADEEDGLELDQGLAEEAGDGATVEDGDGEVDLVTVEPGFDEGLMGVAEDEAELGEAALDVLEDGGEVVAQDDGGGGHAEGLGGAAAEAFADGLDVPEEGTDELVEVLAGRGELEGAPVEELEAEVGLELEDLAGDGGLLDAVGHVADGLHDAAVAGDVVEQLQVMDVRHGGVAGCGWLGQAPCW